MFARIEGPVPVLVVGLLVAGCGVDTTWKQIPALEESGWLMNVWSPSAERSFVVGGSLSDGAALTREAEEWQALPLPADTELVNWVFGFDESDVTLVANGGRILHWDGAAADLQETPVTEDLWGVWGAAPDDLWAVGGSGMADSRAVILHFDGARWTESTLPELVRPARGLFKVWGTSADNVYAVGHLGIVLHWQGSEWVEEFVGASEDLVSIWGTGPDDIVAVGGRTLGLVSYWNGAEWRTERYGRIPGLNGVWMGTPGVAHASGLGGSLLTVTVPEFEMVDESIETELDFHAIHGAGDRLIAVGGNIGADGAPVGLAYERRLTNEE